MYNHFYSRAEILAYENGHSKITDTVYHNYVIHAYENGHSRKITEITNISCIL